MQCPVPLELAQVALGRLLVLDLEVPVVEHHLVVVLAVVAAAPAPAAVAVGHREGHPHLEVPEPLGGEAEGELVAAALVLEAVDGAEGLGDGDIEDEVGEGEEGDWGPAVAALEAGGGLGEGAEEEGEEDEEEEEEAVELLLLLVDGALLLQGLLEVELDYGVQRLEGRLLRLLLLLLLQVMVVVVVVVAALVVRHCRRLQRWCAHAERDVMRFLWSMGEQTREGGSNLQV